MSKKKALTIGEAIGACLKRNKELIFEDDALESAKREAATGLPSMFEAHPCSASRAVEIGFRAGQKAGVPRDIIAKLEEQLREYDRADVVIGKKRDAINEAIAILKCGE